jgi:signal transduction histidine kinase
MFFEWSRRFCYSSRISRVLTFFTLLLSFAVVLHVLGLVVSKKHLQYQDFSTTQLALQEYLKQYDLLQSGSFTLGSPPVELDFIRFVRGDEQLLISGNKQFELNTLVDLAPTISGVWLDLMRPSHKGEWILVSVPLAKGGIAQAGKNVAHTGVAVYRLILNGSKWVLICSAIVSLLLALLLVYMLEIPLRELESSLNKSLRVKDLSIPERETILTPLFQLLEKVFYQNRSLIIEMQSSLDNVAHDLRTPMTRLRAIAEYTLQADTTDLDIYRNALSDCLEESERVVSMLGVMMSVAEAEAGTMRLDLQPVNVLATLEDVAVLYEYVAEEAGITILCDGEAELVIQADKTRISQVWANLLDNAIKYSEESGTVTIHASTRGREVIVSFLDTGMGISKSEIDRIWERLYRGDRSRSKQGLGLGLNYVKAVVEAHHGKALVSSTILEGSCFSVHLPLQLEVTD